MDFSVGGYVGQVDLPQSFCLLPLFEAVVNSILAVRAVPGGRSGKIVVSCRRLPQLTTDGETLNPFVSFEIADDGEGFQERNFKAFDEAFTTNRQHLGCKGVGRFTWLKAFENVRIDSTYTVDGKWWRRRFDFNLRHNGIGNDNLVELPGLPASGRSTTVLLDGFRDPYRSRAPKTVEAIGRRILSHCFAYLRAENPPSIIVRDDDNAFDVTTTFKEEVGESLVSGEVKVGEHTFCIEAFRAPRTAAANHVLRFIANSREVEDEPLTKKTLPELPRKLDDDPARPTLVVHLSGAFLDQRLSTVRTGLTIPESREDGELPLGEPTKGDIREAAAGWLRSTYKDVLEPLEEAKRQRVREYVRQKAPQYRVILERYPDEVLKIPADLSEEKIDLELHKRFYRLEAEAREQSHQFLDRRIEDLKDYEAYRKKLIEFVNDVDEIGKSTLAHHVIHRLLILDLLDHNIKVRRDGKYEDEEVIHNFFFPMKATTDDGIDERRQNLWIIDEKLAYHYYLASDKGFREMDTSDSESPERPDVLVWDVASAFTEDQKVSSLVIIEFKKPGRTDYSKSKYLPLPQLQRYVSEIRDGRLTDKDGRRIPMSPGTPVYAYVLCDIVPQLEAQLGTLQHTDDRRMYFGHHIGMGGWVQIIDYSKVIEDARKRSQILFDKLNLPHG